MSDPDISVRENRELSRYEAEIEGLLAIVEINRIPGKIVVSHTEVPQKLEGRGIASAMYRFLLAAARAEGSQIIPVCPVFAVYLQRHPETHDLIDPGFRRSLGLPPLPEKS